MTDFETLRSEKRDLIINAALKEFSSRGYQLASTNRIVEEAGISKGSLFQYFGSKGKLYLYLFDYAHGMMQKTLYDAVKLEEPDLFIRMENLAGDLADLLMRFPETMDFMLKAKKEKVEPVASMISKKKRESVGKLADRLFENIDRSLFRDDLDFELIRFSVLSCMETYFSEAVPFPGGYRSEEEKQAAFFLFCRNLFMK